MIGAVVVTYNRKELVLECLNAILNQSLNVDEIILIDNNSTDGTFSYLEENKIFLNEKILYKKLDENIGGSGGFFEGMKIAREKKFDWVWIMDDDTIPEKDCLNNLIQASTKIDGKISFLASTIYGINNEFMNVPAINLTNDSNGYPTWYKYLKQGIVSIKEATFVSLLINGKAIEKCGLPIKDYFIWGDDTEYTNRIVKNFGEAYFVGDSIAIHKRKISKSTDITNEEDKNRLNMYFYMFRNNLINAKLYGGKIGVLKTFLRYQIMILKIITSKTSFKLKKIHMINKGCFVYFFKLYNYKQIEQRFRI